MKKDRVTILDNINGEIRRRGMTQDDLCGLLDIDRKTYSNWKSRGEMPETKLLKCAIIFNCSVDYLVRDVDVSAS